MYANACALLVGVVTFNRPVPYCQHFNPTNKTLKKGLLLPKLVELFNCTGVAVSGFTAQNSPFWTVVPTYSSDVLVRGMTILNPRNVGQTDGAALHYVHPTGMASAREDPAGVPPHSPPPAQ